jgi:hypothetical protein
MQYVYEKGFCIGYMDGDRLVRFINPLLAHAVAEG